MLFQTATLPTLDPRPAPAPAPLRPLTSTARTVSFLSSTSLQYVTGAAHMTLSVKTPAATASVSHVMSARSALVPLARSPPYMPGRRRGRGRDGRKCWWCVCASVGGGCGGFGCGGGGGGGCVVVRVCFGAISQPALGNRQGLWIGAAAMCCWQEPRARHVARACTGVRAATLCLEALGGAQAALNLLPWALRDQDGRSGNAKIAGDVGGSGGSRPHRTPHLQGRVGTVHWRRLA